MSFYSALVFANVKPVLKGTSELSYFNKERKGFEVLWWNVANRNYGGVENQKKLYQNIKYLLEQKDQPDVLIFGEWPVNQLNPDIDYLLTKNYPYQIFRKYGHSRGTGLYVYSKEPVDTTYEVMMDWAPPHYSEVKKKAYRKRWKEVHDQVGLAKTHGFPRLYFPIKIKSHGEEWNLVPTHILNIWSYYLKAFGSLSAKFAIADALITNLGNPQYQQVRVLRSLLEKDFSSMNQKRLVLMGDFNFPTHVGPFQTVAHKLLTKDSLLRQVVEEDYPSFPGSNVKIDHAYVSDDVFVNQSTVLPMLGSDHYPILRPHSTSKELKQTYQ